VGGAVWWLVGVGGFVLLSTVAGVLLVIRELSAAERARKERRDAITYRDAVRRHEERKGILETGRGRMSEPGAAGPGVREDSAGL